MQKIIMLGPIGRLSLYPYFLFRKSNDIACLEKLFCMSCVSWYQNHVLDYSSPWIEPDPR